MSSFVTAIAAGPSVRLSGLRVACLPFGLFVERDTVAQNEQRSGEKRHNNDNELSEGAHYKYLWWQATAGSRVSLVHLHLQTPETTERIWRSRPCFQARP